MQSFDLATMKESEMDFTASFELRLSESGTIVPGVTLCYGIALWFDTGFTNRFCKENPVVLSTSPFCTPTHWSQTIFTFEEPIAMVKESSTLDSSASVGTDESPATMLKSRISIVRASEHRSIDISVETTAFSKDGRKRSWPIQIFNLWLIMYHFWIKFASFLPSSAINSNCYQCSIRWPSFACWMEHFAQLEWWGWKKTWCICNSDQTYCASRTTKMISDTSSFKYFMMFTWF